jgi:hypothetical protein
MFVAGTPVPSLCPLILGNHSDNLSVPCAQTSLARLQAQFLNFRPIVLENMNDSL